MKKQNNTYTSSISFRHEAFQMMLSKWWMLKIDASWTVVAFAMKHIRRHSKRYLPQDCRGWLKPSAIMIQCSMSISLTDIPEFLHKSSIITARENYIIPLMSVDPFLKKSSSIGVLMLIKSSPVAGWPILR